MNNIVRRSLKHCAFMLASLSMLLYGENSVKSSDIIHKYNHIGKWTLVNAEEESPFMRISGKFGVTKFYLTPRSINPDLNFRFSLSCSKSGEFLNVDVEDIIGKDLVLQSYNIEISNDIIIINLSHLPSRLESDGSFVENNMLKKRIDNFNIDLIKRYKTFMLNVVLDGRAIRFLYHADHTNEAVLAWLNECRSTQIQSGGQHG